MPLCKHFKTEIAYLNITTDAHLLGRSLRLQMEVPLLLHSRGRSLGGSGSKGSIVSKGLGPGSSTENHGVSQGATSSVFKLTELLNHLLQLLTTLSVRSGGRLKRLRLNLVGKDGMSLNNSNLVVLDSSSNFLGSNSNLDVELHLLGRALALVEDNPVLMGTEGRVSLLRQSGGSPKLIIFFNHRTTNCKYNWWFICVTYQ